MNKLVFVFLSLTILLASCGQKTSKEEATNNDAPVSNSTETADAPEKETENEAADPTSILLGTWTGTMSNKELTVVIEEVNGNELVGYNVLGSNKRALKGAFEEAAWDQPCSKAYEAVLNEPGDDKWDGVFKIKFVGYEEEEETEDGPECMGNLQGEEAIGDWTPNNGKPAKSFMLSKEEK